MSYAEKFSHCVDFAERYAGLSHSPRAGVHSEKDSAGSVRAHVKVLGEAVPSVTQRVIGVRNRRRERQSVYVRAKACVKFKDA